jgi:glycosyltransferase involved in cell wall biosynthesis
MSFEPSISDSATRHARPQRVVWITPEYPPDRGGVSDNSCAMVDALRAAGHEVLVCSRPHEQGFGHLDADLRSFRPDLMVVAYVPLGYGPRTGGIAPAFAFWCFGLRGRLNCRAVLLAHEASLPVVYFFKQRQLKLAALGVVQAAQFRVLVPCFDAVLFSTEGTRQIWARGMPNVAGRFHTIRICSNIPYHPSADPTADLISAGHSVPSTTILFFGTGHDSALLDYVEEAFVELLKIAPDAGLVVVGMDSEKLRRLRPSFEHYGARVQALGYVAAPQVSLWLQAAKLVLAPLIEGVSARKTTVMAALQHGRAVLTTRGFHTRSDIAWDEICILAPLDRKAFAAAAVNALRNLDWREEIGRAARTEYEAHASALVAASRILDYAKLSQRDSRAS